MKLKIALVFLTVCVMCYSAEAQSPYISRDGRFEVDQIKGCAPLTVNISILAPNVCSPGIPCELFFLSGVDPIQKVDNTFFHQYTEPGTYSLRILFQGVAVIDQISITVVPNTPPEFEIYSCDLNSAQVKITDTNYDQYVIHYNDGSPDVLVPSGNLAFDTHAFPAPGPYNVTVTGQNLNAADNCNSTTKSLEAVDALPVPTITQLTVLNDRDIQLDFDNEPNTLYRLQISRNSAGSFQNLQDIYEASSVTINNLFTDDNYYCFRLGVVDPCNNSIQYSNTICSSNFDVIAQNNQNRISWSTSAAGVINYSFTKNSSPPLTAASGASVLDDTNVTCGVEYCYQQTTEYAGGIRSISLSKCVDAISTNIPTVVENISTIVGTDNSVELQWTQDPAFISAGYVITKSINGTFASRDSSATTTFTDVAYLNEVAACYTINYQDACENKSPMSAVVCPIQLLGALEPNNVINLSWNAYEGWENGVDHYIVQKYDEAGQLLATINTGTMTNYTDNSQDLLNQVGIYTVTAIANQAGIVPSVSNTITIVKEPNLFYPTAFTPNNDGLNDIFNVYGQFISTFEMRIFNRWGELMYTTDDLEKGWNGFYKGNVMPEGTYVFRANITDQAGRSFERSGTVVLLRK